MAGKNTAVFGIYPNRPAAEEAIASLRNAGFRGTDVSVLFPENLGTKDLGHEKHSKAPEGATTGGLAGGITGGVLGWLTGIGALAIPGIGPLIAAGPIVAALAGVGAVGALGGLVGALAGLGIPEYEAKRYEGRVRDGGVLLSVHCDSSDWVKRAKDILDQTGAQEVGAAGEKAGDFANADKPLPRVRKAGSVLGAEEDTVTAEAPARTAAADPAFASPERVIAPVRRRNTTISDDEDLTDLEP
jgi:hypothetical protein